MINRFKLLLLCFGLALSAPVHAQQVVQAQDNSNRVTPPGEKLISTITPFNMKGKEIVTWDMPRFAAPPDNPPYRIILSGQTLPGTVVLLDGQVPIAVDQRGRYEFILEIAKPQSITEFQAISPTGGTNNFIISLDLPGKKDQRQAIKKVPKGPPSPDYITPLNFDPKENGVIIQPQSLEYALFPTSDFSLGNVVVRNKDIGITAIRNNKKTYNLRFQWPRVFLSEGTIEIKNATDKTIWSRKIDLGEAKKESARKGDKTKTVDDIMVYQSLPLQNLETFKKNKEVRFCMTGPGDVKVSFCSMPFTFNDSTTKFVAKPLDRPTKIEINGEEFPRRAIVPFKDPKDIYHVKASLANGVNFSFDVGPIAIEFRDILASDDEKIVFITGRGVAPDDFSAEILERDEGWKATFSPPKPTLYFIGVGGIPIRQDFQLTKPLPHETHRIWARKNSPESSYISEIEILGELKNKYQLMSDEFSVTPTDKKKFAWTYKVHERGRTSRSHLKLFDQKQEYTAYYEAYKGFPFELSGRLTGILAAGRLWLLWELAGGAWAESLFGWKNYWLSERRWGLSAKYIKSFAFGGFDPNLTMTNIDLKYRFVPGLWNKDESVGAVLGYQSIAYRGDERANPSQRDNMGNMLGVGLWWARPMPEIFDDIFNIIPWFRYPKWVDLEGIYYLSAMDPSVKLKSGNFNMTFHGKMFFIPEFYMEASFGLKRFAFENSNARLSSEVTMLFGTGGFGYNF
ncbi:MAG: hypothetical protein ABL958_03840 [Bdellovibrionia bacterium]